MYATHLPIGYIEVQRGWVVADDSSSLKAYNEALENILTETKRDRPDLMLFGTRVETVRDGAGVTHRNLYVGFVPKQALSPPLDPHNLNDAPLPRIGGLPPVDEPMLGRKESKF